MLETYLAFLIIFASVAVVWLTVLSLIALTEDDTALARRVVRGAVVAPVAIAVWPASITIGIGYGFYRLYRLGFSDG